MCHEPHDLLNARYTVSMPVSTTIDSDQLHHNVVVMGGTNRNASNVTDTEETALMFLLGSVARYFCDNGYEMTGGDSTLMCFSNGSWIGGIGNCESMYTYVYICVYVCMYVLYVCMYSTAQVYLHSCMAVHAWLHTDIRM